MRTNKGFTLVEVSVAMALMALGGLALMATGNYFLKARLVNETRSSHIVLRNLIQTTLSQVTQKCVGTACTATSQCAVNLQGKSANVLTLNSSISDLVFSHRPITAANGVEITIANGGTILLRSGNAASAPNERELSDHLRYKAYLVGEFKSESKSDSTITYMGSVEVVGDRSILGRSDSLTANVPLEFTFDTGTWRLKECTTRADERMLANENNSIDKCVAMGGLPVPTTSMGLLCRFRTPPNLFSSTGGMPCPPGFVGDPNIFCTPDTNPDSLIIDSIPDCPAIALAPSGCLDGFYRTQPGIGPCTACSTPAVLGTGVVYKSTGTRTAPTDCEVLSIASCNAGYHLVGKTCQPDPVFPATVGCNLSTVFTGGFSSPTGANLTGGSISVRYTGQSAPDTVTATISPNAGAKAHLTNSTFRFSVLPQGNYTITVTDPLYGPDCKVTLQKTLRVGGYFPDPVKAQGNLYCSFQGYPGEAEAPPCPVEPIDPEDPTDPANPDYQAPTAWELVNFDAAKNLRTCRYPFECDSPNVIKIYQPPDGDGKTPSCVRVITECPEPDPAISPPLWQKISANPLKCKLYPRPTPTLAIGLPCPSGFKALTPSELSEHAELKQWLPTASAFSSISWALCY